MTDTKASAGASEWMKIHHPNTGYCSTTMEEYARACIAEHVAKLVEALEASIRLIEPLIETDSALAPDWDADAKTWLTTAESALRRFKEGQ